MRIVLTGGGSGGHITPLIAVARKLREKVGSELELLYIGSGAKMERDFMTEEGIRAQFVMTGKMRRYFSFQNFVDFFKVPVGFVQALWFLLVFMPDAIFSKGGYVSVPVVLAAWIYRIPIIVHESDATPGTANQILGKLADNIVLAYPYAQNYFEASRTAIWGNPIREDLLGGNPAEARSLFNFSESKPVILVLGGSQGAQVINESVVRLLPKILSRAQVVHQTGETDFENTVRLAGEYGFKAGHGGYYPVAFMDSSMMRNAYALADLIISRAAATSISEISASKKASILVPLENSANDHQRMNAYEIAKMGGAIVLEETNLGKNIFWEKIEELLSEGEMRSAMAKKAETFYHPNAAENIANGIIKLATS
jgi:UDP-N-acetylglucosamine--N-acetylmuramyl-(pentapeptide) pyrophosphoryl-undecaprenol N-acetylglucosamine transferase